MKKKNITTEATLMINENKNEKETKTMNNNEKFYSDSRINGTENIEINETAQRRRDLLASFDWDDLDNYKNNLFYRIFNTVDSFKFENNKEPKKLDHWESGNFYTIDGPGLENTIYVCERRRTAEKALCNVARQMNGDFHTEYVTISNASGSLILSPEVIEAVGKLDPDHPQQEIEVYMPQLISCYKEDRSILIRDRGPCYLDFYQARAYSDSEWESFINDDWDNPDFVHYKDINKFTLIFVK